MFDLNVMYCERMTNFVKWKKKKILTEWGVILQEEAKLREVLKYANACGAITTTKKGAIPALPTEPEVLTLVKG